MKRHTWFIGLATLGLALAPVEGAPAGEFGTGTTRPASAHGTISRLKTSIAGRLHGLLPRRSGAADGPRIPAGPVIGDDAPDWFRERVSAGRPLGLGVGERVVKGRLSATRERALADARLAVDRAVADWLAPDVPPSWKAPKPLVEGLIRRTHVEPITRGDLGVPELKDFAVVYLAGHAVDFSPARRQEAILAYNRELVAKRLGLLGGVLGVSLIGLVGLAGYIRADEATKGYYTNRLRLLAAAGVGAASVTLYRWVL